MLSLIKRFTSRETPPEEYRPTVNGKFVILDEPERPASELADAVLQVARRKVKHSEKGIPVTLIVRATLPWTKWQQLNEQIVSGCEKMDGIELRTFLSDADKPRDNASYQFIETSPA